MIIEAIGSLVRRRRLRQEAVQILSKRFWRVIENREYTVVIAGNRWAVRDLTACAEGEQLGRVHNVLSLPRILVPWTPAAGEDDIDLILVPVQRFKNDIAQRVQKRFPNIPVYVLYESVLIEGMLQRLETQADIEKAPPPRKTYVIASSRRTGSSMLCDMLRETGFCGYPGEYISLKTTVLAEQKIVDAGSVLTGAIKLDQTPNGVFGIKTHWSALELFNTAVLPLLSDQEKAVVQGLYHRSSYVFLTRRNKIRQAISDWRAGHTGVSYVPETTEDTWKEKHRKGQAYEYPAIKRRLKDLIADDEHWKQFFQAHSIVPVKVVYEDLVEKPRETVSRIAKHLDLDRTHFDVAPRLKRLSDEDTEVIYERFVRDLSEDLGDEIVCELTGSEPRPKVYGKRDGAPRERVKTSVLCTLATSDHLDQAKQLFASAYFNAGWNGDYLLLAHDIPESELSWFRDRGILVKHCAPLYDGQPGGLHACLADKLYLFTPYFRRWDTVIYSDLDVIVRAPLDELKEVEGFCAVEDWSPTLREQIVNDSDIGARGLDKRECESVIEDAKKRFRLSKRPFCAGFFAFSTSIIEEDTFDRLRQTLDKYQVISKFGDQLSFNFFFYDQWIKLRPTYDILVRQERVISPYKSSREATTRWGLVNQLDGYILHIFNPKPWNVTSHFYLEWLANLRRAESLDLANVPLPDPERLARTRSTEVRIRRREQVYNFGEHFGSQKTRVVRVLQFPYDRYMFLRHVLLLAGKGVRDLFRGRSLDR